MLIDSARTVCQVFRKPNRSEREAMWVVLCWMCCAYLASLTAFAANVTLWTIGTPDNSSREFGGLTKPVIYHVGKISPTEDWFQDQSGQVDESQSVTYDYVYRLGANI